MRAFLYARYSTALQEEGHSLHAQLSANRKLVESRNWTLAATFVDEAWSGATTDRPRFKRMLRLAHAGRCDVIVVHKLDRLTRSLIDLLLMLRDLDKAGIKLVSASEQFDFTSPIGRVMLVMLIALAEWFLSNLKGEIAKGKRARVSKGFANSPHAPYGYISRHHKDGHDGIMVPHDDESEVVRWLYQQYATGTLSDRELARMLNSRGVRPRKVAKDSGLRWSQTTVRRVLTNRVYLGEVQYRGEWSRGWHEPIIALELYEACEEVRAERANRRGLTRPSASRVFVLSGVARCARCGRAMCGRVSHVRKYAYAYYADQSRTREAGCSAPWIRAEYAEAAAGEYVQSLSLPANWRDVLALAQSAEQAEADTNTEARHRLEAELERLKLLFEVGDRTWDAYVKRRDEIRRELARLRPQRAINLEQAGVILEDIGPHWRAADLEGRRHLARAIFEHIDLDAEAKDGPVVSVTLRPAFARLLELCTAHDLAAD